MIALYAVEKNNLWHIDSGCSKHMTGDPNKFISLRKDNKGKVTFRDNVFQNNWQRYSCYQ